MSCALFLGSVVLSRCCYSYGRRAAHQVVRRRLSLSVSAGRAKNRSSESTSLNGKNLQIGSTAKIEFNDPVETLFSHLEDLKNDKAYGSDFDDELTEEDLIKFEQELEDGGMPGHSTEGFMETYHMKGVSELQNSSQLRPWQLRRLAYSLRIGRRKTKIKDLSAELGLDRMLVLELLRHPPPDLLLMSASLPEKAVENATCTESKHEDPENLFNMAVTVESDPIQPDPTPIVKSDVKEPVYIRVNRWSTRKRLKKMQKDTLEKVYSHSRRPSKSMISSIVHLTNLPWKTVLKWFEERRRRDSIPQKYVPYQRAV